MPAGPAARRRVLRARPRPQRRAARPPARRPDGAHDAPRPAHRRGARPGARVRAGTIADDGERAQRARRRVVERQRAARRWRAVAQLEPTDHSEPGRGPDRVLGESLDRVLRGLGAPTSARPRVYEDWDELVGLPLAAHARPDSVVGGRLVVAVDEPGLGHPDASTRELPAVAGGLPRTGRVTALDLRRGAPSSSCGPSGMVGIVTPPW